ncbi:MAG: glycosyltransferase, partial [Spirosomataceae bacterium]
CDAFVLPSHQENFGIAVVEALACGKPVLISDQVNIWREISESGGGLVFDNTVSGLYDALGAYINRGVSTEALTPVEAYKKNYEMSTISTRLIEILV